MYSLSSKTFHLLSLFPVRLVVIMFTDFCGLVSFFTTRFNEYYGFTVSVLEDSQFTLLHTFRGSLYSPYIINRFLVTESSSMNNHCRYKVSDNLSCDSEYKILSNFIM